MKIIYAIPGLGTTKELFRNTKIPNHEIKVLEWPEHKEGITLKEYSKQFISAIDSSSPVKLMGVSFGGMLCVEIANQINTEKLVLISSCKNMNEFPIHFKILKRMPFYSLLSEKIIRNVAKRFYKVLGFDSSFKSEFYKMVDEMTDKYFIHCLKYILHWDRKPSDVKLVHIHGTNDKVLPHQFIKEFIPVKGGSHAMVLNKAKEINSILDNVFNGV